MPITLLYPNCILNSTYIDIINFKELLKMKIIAQISSQLLKYLYFLMLMPYGCVAVYCTRTSMDEYEIKIEQKIPIHQ